MQPTGVHSQVDGPRGTVALLIAHSVVIHLKTLVSDGWDWLAEG